MDTKQKVRDVLELPDDLPVPVDDGACDHLTGMSLPAITLSSTDNGKFVNLGELKGNVVIYCYPRTGRPEQPLIIPEWNTIPGARGCTPQTCSFRDNYDEFKKLGFICFGLSTQTTAYQQEVCNRLHLPFPLLSDEKLELVEALKLPTFKVNSQEVPEPLIKRLTLVIKEGKIIKVFYPVFPPSSDATNVLAWIKEQKQ